MSAILILVSRHLLGVGSILATQILIALALTGVGFIVLRAAGHPPSDSRTCLLATWLGFAVVLQFLSVWHFFAPVTSAPGLAVLTIGIGGFLAFRPRLADVRPNAGRTVLVAAAIVFLGFACWEANLGLGPNTAWDSGLYHIQAVQWARSYPIVPGLANLHGPLGFNNLAFLYFAALDHGPWAARANHVGNGLFTLLLAGYAIAGAVRWTSKDRRVSDFFDLSLIAPAVILSLGGRASDFTTDAGTAAFVLVARSTRSNPVERARRPAGTGRLPDPVLCAPCHRGDPEIECRGLRRFQRIAPGRLRLATNRERHTPLEKHWLASLSPASLDWSG